MSHNILFILLAGIFGLFLTWSVGANDLANVISPAFGSKALKVRHLLLIAIIFELCGALLGGGKVSATIQHGIINIDALNSAPSILVYGMLSALLASSIWIMFATHRGIPVSLTNSIVGSIIGFGIVVLGWNSVNWRTIGFIMLSWVVCPLAAGTVSYSLFSAIQRLILSSTEPLKKTKQYLPYLLFIVGFVLSEITVIRAFKNFGIHFDLHDNILISSMLGLFTYLCAQVFLDNIYKETFSDHKEQFALVERAFTVLMVLTVCAMVYAHGSDDVSTATGPVAVVVRLSQGIQIQQNGNLLLLILTCGYLGVIAGFLSYGRKVVETVGSAITELTPNRAFCATFAAATTVVTSTSMGIPVSATQTLVGAILGIGLARGIGALDLRIVRNIFASWFITLPVTGCLTVLLFYFFRFFFQN